ncbi:MAG: glycosyltransferase [Aphanothece sp. CMT-3BRIN-NPC111]|jgi:glycosyltransferase involved in cell wall biosynthesis|nr:glycosyltransferase [Aphanothece sp. CMT-3BRIN-NPC111]
MASPLVSTIIVVKNGEPYLTEAIDSVISQTYKRYEVIVVDGQSTDKTEKIVKKYPQLRYILQTGDGLADARNTGIEAARGELIAFLDCDDLWAANKLQAQVDCLVSYPNIQYAIARLKLFLEPGCSLRPGFNKESFGQPQLGYTPGTLIARKSLFAQVGLFNPKFKIGCDVDWFARVKDRHIPMAVISEVLLYKRIHSTNLSGNIKVNKQELLSVVKQSVIRQRHKNLK